MAVSREVDPLTTPALAAITAERLFQPRLARVHDQVAGVQKQLNGIQTV
jgi:hypothetical protein